MSDDDEFLGERMAKAAQFEREQAAWVQFFCAHRNMGGTAEHSAADADRALALYRERFGG